MWLYRLYCLVAYMKNLNRNIIHLKNYFKLHYRDKLVLLSTSVFLFEFVYNNLITCLLRCQSEYERRRERKRECGIFLQ